MLRKKTHLFTVGMTAFVLQSGFAVAQSQSASPEETESKELDTVVVVGSAIRSASSDITAQPIQILGRDRLDQTPAISVADFLQEVPIANGFNANATTGEYDGASSQLNLRGLGGQYTLVLVNGRRLGGENIPDISAIPPEAVESVQILKTGASSIYGSDAVAGVVNVELRDDFQGVELHASYGELTLGGGETSRLAGLFGLNDGPFSLTGSLAYQKNDGFTKFERDLTRSRNLVPLGGIDRRSGTATEPGAFFTDNGAFVIDLSRFGPGDVVDSLDDFVPRTAENAISTQEDDKLQPIERFSGHWASEYEFSGADVNFYTSGYFDNRNASISFLPSMTVVNVAADNPNNPFGEDVRTFYLFSPTDNITAVDFGGTSRDDSMRLDTNTFNIQAVGGLRGDLGDGLSWDVGYTYFRNKTDLNQRNDISTARAQAAVESGEFNPFCIFCNDLSLRDELTADFLIERSNEVRTVDATLSGDLFDWSQGTVQFAVGYQYRDIKFSETPDDTAQNNSYWWWGSNGAPVSGGRDVNAVFGEVKIPLYNNENSGFLQSAEVSGAVRREEYSDFGASDVWQALGRAGFLDDQVILRGSYAKTFRAPSIDALTRPIVTAETGGISIFDPTTNSLITEAIITRGGNPDLDPEIGKTLSFGAIVQPSAIPNLFLSIDYFDIEISDIIRTPDLAALAAGVDPAGTITRPGGGGLVEFDIRSDNGGQLESAGFDISAIYNLDAAFADLSFFLNATRLTKFEETSAGETVVHLDEFSQTYNAVAKLRLVSGVTAERGPVSANLAFNYNSGVRDFLAGTPIDRRTDAYETVDLQVNYDFEEAFGSNERNGLASGLSAYVGAENIFGHEPVFVGEARDGVLEAAPNTLAGRYIYAGVRKRF